MGGFNINIEEMKKKTEIENMLLFTLNKTFQEYIADIKYAKNNFEKIDSDFGISDLKQISEIKELETKLLEHPDTIYNLFQCFYIKRKSVMGMNLTGLIQGKMETGLGFRSHITKQNYYSIKDDKIKNIVMKRFTEHETNIMSNIIVYTIKSGTFEWDKFGLEKSSVYYIIINPITQKYFISI